MGRLEKVALSDYQEVSRDFLRHRTFAGLFDSPGVGKTAPSIVAAHQAVEATGEPALITAPAYLLDNWAYEISRFAPGATVGLANGTGYDARHEVLTSQADFILTSYNNWSAGKGKIHQYPELVDRPWSALVFDEAHRLRGRNSRTYRHVYQVRGARSPNKGTPIWALTGTPIVNNPGDLFPLFSLWDKRKYRGYWNFVNEWCVVAKTPFATIVGQLRPGLEDAWHELLEQFALRRTLADVPSLADLEERHHHYEVTMPPSVRKTIGKARKEYVVEHPELAQSEFVSNGGALYARLRQLATVPPTQQNPKADLVRELLEDNPGQLVVYVWYKLSANEIASRIAGTGRPVTTITGDVPTAQRGERVDEWRRTSNGVLVATISSLKEGISLTTAFHVVFLEHSELPADQLQCVARLKRRGQKSLVTVSHVWARGTPDIAIRRALEERGIGLQRALTDWLLSDD